MSYTTLKPNDTVFVKNIGYGTLLDCGNFNVVSFKVPGQLQKRDSIYFDPDLFASDDSSNSKKNEKQITQVPKIVSESVPEVVQTMSEKKEKEKQEVQQPINIVKVRLESTKVIVHVPDTDIKKSVIIRIKPMFARSVGIINVSIDITKTIQTLKKQIFDELGLKLAYYYNIKFFTTSPTLAELNVHSKTILQYGIMESSIITVTADHGFCFEGLPSGFEKYYAVPNNNMTFVALKRELPKIPEPELPISLPPPPPQVMKQGDQGSKQIAIQAEPPKEQAVILVQPPRQVPEVAGEDKKLPQNQVKEIEKEKEMVAAGDNKSPEKQDSQNKQKEATNERKEQDPDKSLKKAVSTVAQLKGAEVPEFYEIKGQATFSFGRHYWQVKIDKVPKKSMDLQVGLMNERKNKAWIYQPLVSQKMQREEGKEGEKVQYGVNLKEGDSLGVLVQFNKQKMGKVNFYKNNVGLGTCFKNVEGQVRPIFGIGSQGQISLDSRAPIPIDAYRFS